MLGLGAGALAAVLVPSGVHAQGAQAWPGKPVTLVVPYPPGGTSDVIGRQLAQRLGEDLGAVFTVDNKAGAATAIGATWFAVFAPGGTPKPVIDKLGTALRKITASASFGEAMRKLGNEAKTSTPAELREVTLQQSKS